MPNALLSFTTAPPGLSAVFQALMGSWLDVMTEGPLPLGHQFLSGQLWQLDWSKCSWPISRGFSDNFNPANRDWREDLTLLLRKDNVKQSQLPIGFSSPKEPGPQRWSCRGYATLSTDIYFLLSCTPSLSLQLINWWCSNSVSVFQEATLLEDSYNELKFHFRPLIAQSII